MKMVDKASNFTTYKKLTQEELGDSAKYIKITTKDKNGRKIKPLAEVDQTKIDEDLKYAGYNLMVTQNWIWNRFKCIRPIITYGKSRSHSGSRSPIWMRGRFTCKKKKQSMGIF